MSDYGKLWAKVAVIRDRLKAWCPEMSTNTLADAKRYAAESMSAQPKLRASVDYELRSWEELEEEMAQCDSHTGNR